MNAHPESYVAKSGPRHRHVIYVDASHGGPKRIRTPWRAKRADALADRYEKMQEAEISAPNRPQTPLSSSPSPTE